MTRLQHSLSQIKTVDELAKTLGVSSAAILKRVGLSKDDEQLIPCEGKNCEKCAFYHHENCVSNCDYMISYLNGESTNVNHESSTPVIAMRDNARKLLKIVVLEGLKQGHSALTVYRHLDEYIDVLENVGLFEENELRTYVSIDLADLISTKQKENHK